MGRGEEEQHKPGAVARVRRSAGESAAGRELRGLLPTGPQRTGNYYCAPPWPISLPPHPQTNPFSPPVVFAIVHRGRVAA